MKQDIEQKLQEKRDQFENYTREAATNLNDLNNQVLASYLKLSLEFHGLVFRCLN
jgi:hypothetical protein